MPAQSSKSDSTAYYLDESLARVFQNGGTPAALAAERLVTVERERCAILAEQMAANCPNSRVVLLILADLIRSGEDDA